MTVQRKKAGITGLVLAALLAGCGGQAVAPSAQNATPAAKKEHRFVVLDPGHFHAALVFKRASYENVSPLVGIYAPVGLDYVDHMARVAPFNTRAQDPADWRYKSYLGPDFERAMFDDAWGDIAVISGKNAPKIDRILDCVRHGLNVLADKPWVIEPAKLAVLDTVLSLADEKGLVAYDIMTERSEITSILQRELVQDKSLSGDLVKGTPEDPGVVIQSVHHLYKLVAGVPNKRPGWFFDTAVQGEGLVDVTTHLVDITFWCLFPDQPIDYKIDIVMHSAAHWPTPIDREQFKKVTGMTDFPPEFKLDDQGRLEYFCNGKMNFSVRGVEAQMQVDWRFEAPEGTGDTHSALVRCTLANVMILQGKEQNYRPELYVEAAPGADPQSVGKALAASVESLAGAKYPGLELKTEGSRWHILIPDKYRVGHEQHFGQVTDRFLSYLGTEKIPAWEHANMLAKYYVTTTALELARQK